MEILGFLCPHGYWSPSTSLACRSSAIQWAGFPSRRGSTLKSTRSSEKSSFLWGDGDDPRRPWRSEPSPTMAAFGVNNALVYNDPLPLAQYLIIQTFIWPLRLVYTIVMLSIVIAFGFPTFAGKLLMRCKRCVDI